jgi:hypothetical protein
MNLILGSGIIGYLAKHILGSEWEWIPFKKSRYFTFEIPYADNFVAFDDQIDPIMLEMSPKNKTKIFMKRAFSLSGQLMYQESSLTIDTYLQKVYGDQIPSLAQQLIKTNLTTYPMTAKQLHDKLYEIYLNQVNTYSEKYGTLSKIDLKLHKIYTSIGEFGYDKIVSTIPLDALVDYCGLKMNLPSKAVCYYLIKSGNINLEGADQALICDSVIDFFKVQKIDDYHQFWSFDIINMPYQYFGSIIGYDFDLLEAKRIDNVIPLGEPPNLELIEKHGVFCVGSNAQWDDFVGITTAVKRLFRIKSS